MSAVTEARRHPVPIPATPREARPGGDPKADPTWAAMMDGLSTYVRDHEKLYRLLAR